MVSLVRMVVIYIPHPLLRLEMLPNPAVDWLLVSMCALLASDVAHTPSASAKAFGQSTMLASRVSKGA